MKITAWFQHFFDRNGREYDLLLKAIDRRMERLYQDAPGIGLVRRLESRPDLAEEMRVPPSGDFAI